MMMQAKQKEEAGDKKGAIKIYKQVADEKIKTRAKHGEHGKHWNDWEYKVTLVKGYLTNP